MQSLLVARSVLTGLLVVASASGCGSATVASPTPSSPAAVLPTLTLNPAPTVTVPTSFAAWTERQGFGGSSGLNNVRQLARWLTENTFDATVSNLDSDGGDVAVLIAWLDAHPPTACWIDYHAAMRSSLETVTAEYAEARAAVASGKYVPLDLATAIYDETQKAYAMPAPVGCP